MGYNKLMRKSWLVILVLGLLVSPTLAQEITKSPNFIIEAPTFSNGANSEGTLGINLTSKSTAAPATPIVPGKGTEASMIVRPEAVLADGQSQIAVLVLVNDAEKQPLANKSITLSTSRPDKDVIEEPVAATGVNGVAIFKLKSQFTGQTAITARSGDTVIATGRATFFSSSRVFLRTTSPWLLLAGLFLIFEFFRWLFLLGFWRRRRDKNHSRS
ncbi:MAG: Ig-like domain-containing protein [bacterium]|nr:Ig-like domain-containing protein [bacterium]